jgi:tetratricopeptide (TPR) repeat protein
MRLLAQLLTACLLFSGSSALAQGVIDMGGMPEQEAKAHFKVGKSLYESGRFAEAAAEWSKAYELSQRNELLYNVYVAYRDASDVPHAIDALRRYLQGAELDDATRQNLQARLRAMEESNSKAPVVAVTPSDPEPASTTAAPAPAPEPATEPAPPAPAASSAADETTASSDEGGSVVPYVLLGVGGALLAGAAVTGVIVLGNESDLEDDCTDERCTTSDSQDKLDATKSLAVVTDALWITGTVAAVVGGALLIFGGDSGSEESASRSTRPVASVGCAPGTCTATLRGHF